ncbi:MAG: efflux RND transporter periplasmic adaptor subunit [bacterium]
MKKILILISILLIIVLVYVFLFQDEDITGDEIEVFTITNENTVSSLRASGIIIPEKIIEVKASRSGIIEFVSVSEGSNINEKSLLYKYDDDIPVSELEQADANLEHSILSLEQAIARKREAESAVELAAIRLKNTQDNTHKSTKSQIEQKEIEIENAEEKVERNRKLLFNNAIEENRLKESLHNLNILKKQKEIQQYNLEDLQRQKENQIEEAEQTLRQRRDFLSTTEKDVKKARANVEIARSALRQAELLLEKHRINSPITGIVLEKHIEEGEYVQPGELIYKIASDSLKVRISPDERELNLLTVGKKGYISPDAYPEEIFNVEIRRISPIIDDDRGTIDIYLNLLENSSILLANMSVSVEINNNMSDIYIPSKYIYSDDNNIEYVFVYEKNQAVKRLIDIGHKNTQGRVEIINGLNEGDVILYSSNIEDGMQLKIQE